MNDKEKILSKISETAIVEKFFSEPILLNKKYKNPYRVDNTPTCTFQFKDGKLKFYDWARNRTYDSFDIVKEYLIKEGRYIDFHSVIKEIDKQFKLNLFPTSFKPTENNEIKIEPMVVEKKSNYKLNITPYVKNFSKEELEYWKKYELTPEDLEAAGVSSLSGVWLGKIYLKSTKNFPIYMYDLDDKEPGKYLQIYTPNNRIQKATSNLPVGYLMGSRIACKNHSSHDLIITSSYKDAMILNKCKIASFAPVGEFGKILDVDLIEMNTLFSINVLFDNDDAGRLATDKLIMQCEKLGITVVDLSNLLEGEKDPGEFVEKYGIGTLQDIFHSHNIW